MTIYTDLHDAPAKQARYTSKYDPAPVGKRFGTRVVVSAAPRSGQDFRWTMLCDCGERSIAHARAVVQGRAQRCEGCARRRQGAAAPQWKGDGGVSLTAYSAAKFSAESRGIAWQVSIADLAAAWSGQGGVCAMSGRPMTMKRGNRYPSNASLDRKDSRRPYTPDNIQWVRVEINMAKQQLSEADFIGLCRDATSFRGGR